MPELLDKKIYSNHKGNNIFTINWDEAQNRLSFNKAIEDPNIGIQTFEEKFIMQERKKQLDKFNIHPTNPHILFPLEQTVSQKNHNRIIDRYTKNVEKRQKKSGKVKTATSSFYKAKIYPLPKLNATAKILLNK